MSFAFLLLGFVSLAAATAGITRLAGLRELQRLRIVLAGDAGMVVTSIGFYLLTRHPFHLMLSAFWWVALTVDLLHLLRMTRTPA